MKTFTEFLVSEWLIDNNYEVTQENIQYLIEAGFLDRFKKWGKGAALAGAMAAGATGFGGGNAYAAGN
ncbi:MAG: hypothetical protein NTV38_13045, partial [Chloroflexi bacterium]|nr:hypothetical protein [Chloroflexota bacterium]